MENNNRKEKKKGEKRKEKQKKFPWKKPRPNKQVKNTYNLCYKCYPHK